MVSASVSGTASRAAAMVLLALTIVAGVAMPAAARKPSAGLGLPPDAVSAPDPVRVALGRRLFMDRRLSPNDTMSCAMCHVPEQGFAVNEIATAVGLEGRSLKRNAPTLLNVGLQRTLFHDGRSPSLEDQVWGPLLAREEMGNGTKAAAVRRVARIPDYRQRFRKAFPDRGLTAGTLAAALAAYERSLVAADSPFDRFRYGGDPDTLSPAALRGLAVFEGKAACASCHRVDGDHASLTDHAFHDTGIGSLSRASRKQGYAVQLAPGEFTSLRHEEVVAAFGNDDADDGRQEHTRRLEDRDRFKTPSLRNVALTAPYMHDGSIATLEEVIDHYDRGGSGHAGQDPRIRPLGLTNAEKSDLVAFLHALTSPHVTTLAAEARADASTPVFRALPSPRPKKR